MSCGRMARKGLRSWWVATGVVRDLVGRTDDGSVKLGWISVLICMGAAMEFGTRDLEDGITSEDSSETSI